MAAELDVVLPLKDRPEVVVAVNAFLSNEGAVRNVIVCDAGSSCSETLRARSELSGDPRVRWLDSPPGPFNRGRLLNRGIRVATAPFVLVSDADVVWGREALAEVTDRAGALGTLCHVAEVVESATGGPASGHTRLGFEVVERDSGWEVLIVEESGSAADGLRPGPGLVCADRMVWGTVGGYNESLEGWGWEDQDLLIRATILGLTVTRAGRVTHITHDDSRRDVPAGSDGRRRSRDANIRRSADALESGRLTGPLAGSADPRPAHVRVRLPETVRRAGEG